MAKSVQDFRVIRNRKIGTEFFILELSLPAALPEMKPGQFVQVRIDGNHDTFLRRPFSIYDVDYELNMLKLLCQVVGKGTETMSRLAEGDLINIVFPLGNSFSMPADGEQIILIGGGVGIAPFLFFTRELLSTHCKTDMLFGFRNRERIIDLDDFPGYNNIYITTEDGSVGEKGFVTNHTILGKKKYDRIYCCGPDPMMKAVADYARSKDIFCEVSLENLMACGFGICLCCIVSTSRGNICTCTEGPVFNINELKW